MGALKRSTKMKKMSIALLLLSVAVLMSLQIGLSQSSGGKGSSPLRWVSELTERRDQAEGEESLPTKSRNTPRSFSMEELFNMAVAAREDGYLEESRAYLKAVLRRDPENERATSELTLSTPTRIIITESRIEMPVFSTRRVTAE